MMIRVDVSVAGMPYYADQFGAAHRLQRSTFDQLLENESLTPITVPSGRRLLPSRTDTKNAKICELSFDANQDENADQLKKVLCAIDWAAPDSRVVIAFVEKSNVVVAFLYPVRSLEKIFSLFPERAPPQEELTLSVCLATYNRAPVLAECLIALDRAYHRLVGSFSAMSGRIEVVLVDDGSTDDTPSVIDRVEVSYPLIYERISNSGPAKARTSAIRKARGHIIIIIDDDKIVHEDFLECHYMHHLSKASTYEMAVGKVGWHGETNFLMRHIVSRKGGELFPFDRVPRRIRNRLPSTFFITANVSFKRQLFEVVGGFNSAMFRSAMWEDTELGWRLAMCGARLRYLPTAINDHDHPMTLPDFAVRQYKVGGYVQRLWDLPFMRDHRANLARLADMPLASILHKQYSISALYEVCHALSRKELTVEQEGFGEWLHYIYRQLLFTFLVKGMIGEEDRQCDPAMSPLKLADLLVGNPSRFDFAVLRFLPDGADSRANSFWLADDQQMFREDCSFDKPQMISKLQFEPTKCRTSRFKDIRIELIMSDGTSLSVSPQHLRHNGRESLDSSISFKKPAWFKVDGKFGPVAAIKLSADRQDRCDASVPDEMLRWKFRNLWAVFRHHVSQM